MDRRSGRVGDGAFHQFEFVAIAAKIVDTTIVECLPSRPTAIVENHGDDVAHIVDEHWDHFLTIHNSADLPAVELDDRERDLGVRMVGQHHDASGGWRRERRSRNGQLY